MSNFASDLEKAAGEESILKIVVGDFPWGEYNSNSKPDFSTIKNKVVSWEVARPYLDYEYSRGYGSPDCQAVYAYTKTSIILVWQYDEATGFTKLPRKPTPCEPDMPGGS